MSGLGQREVEMVPEMPKHSGWLTQLLEECREKRVKGPSGWALSTSPPEDLQGGRHK